MTTTHVEATELRAPSLRDLFVPKQPLANPETMEELINHIRYGNEQAASLQERLGERIAESAEALHRLGERFAREGNPEQAIKAYEQSIKIEPGKEPLTALANLLLSQGDEDGWLKTMLKHLDLPFQCENDSDTNQLIAEHFLETGEWEKALPYVEAAARRGFWWNLRQAAWLNGALGNTQRGQEWQEQEHAFWGYSGLQIYILAFDSEPTDWTNKLLDNYYSIRFEGNALERAQCMNVALIRGNYDGAVALLEQSLQMSNDPWYGVYAALICEEQGWLERRDQILNNAQERWPLFPNPEENNREIVKDFLDLYLKANRAENLTPELKHELQALLVTCGDPQEKYTSTSAFIGDLYRFKGEPEMAKSVYSTIVSVRTQSSISEYLAFRGLRLLGEDPVNILQQQKQKLLDQHKKSTVSTGAIP